MGTTEQNVGDCETLDSIANDGGVTVNQILVANPGLEATLSSNNDVLQTNGTIFVPGPVAGVVPAGTDNDHCFVSPRKKKDLVITVQKTDGKPADNIHSIKLMVGGSSELPFNKVGDSQWRCPDYPLYMHEATLHIVLDLHHDRKHTHTYEAPPVKLSVGGMDPLTGTDNERGCAVQKLLANLAYYSGDIDGILSSEESRASLRRFQSLHGLKLVDGLDGPTVRKLINEAGNQLKIVAISPPASDPDNPNLPLPLGDEAGLNWASSKELSDLCVRKTYLEPTDEDQLHRTKINPPRFFPRLVYVAPCDEGSTLNPNVIRMQDHRFVHLDSGRWLKDHRDFSVIWGRHVYLCEYLPYGGGDAVPEGARKGLDKDFFAGIKGQVESPFPSQADDATACSQPEEQSLVKVVNRASAQWAPEGDFDWDQLIVVIPDTHLMNDKNGKVFRDEFELKPELDLLHFVECLSKIEALQNRLHVVHIGDWYDLWMGRPRYWKEDHKWKMDLIEKASDQKWSCGKPNCQGHKNENKTRETCPGPWLCGRVQPPCIGHQNQGEPPCETTVWTLVDRQRMQTGTSWGCGRAWPKCPGTHSGPDADCNDEATRTLNPGMYWTCRRLEPPCFGHPNPSDSCPDIVSGADEVRSWIRQIQGFDGSWVQPLLNNCADLRGETLDSLGPKLKVGDIWLNPAEKAFWNLQDFATLEYLYGNHDNYTINETVSEGYGHRERVIQIGGIFLEHGHRLESILVPPVPFVDIPANQDGAVTGYNAAMGVYRNRERVMTMTENQKKGGPPPAPVTEGFVKDTIGRHFAPEGAKPGYEVMTGLEDFADKGTKAVQQPQFWSEFACVWLGRSSNGGPGEVTPHVFVMGHTHTPMLAYIVIDPSAGG